MLHALLVFAAEAAEHEEPSKTAFYVIGGLLVIVAVGLSVVGLNRPDFPGTPAVARGVAGLMALLVGATIVSAILTG